MAEFEIRTTNIKRISNKEYTISKKMDSISEQIRTASGNLRLEAGSELKVRSELVSLAETTHQYAASIRKYADSLNSISGCYEMSEKSISSYQMNGLESDTGSTISGKNKTGKATQASKESNPISWLINDFSQKGISWKLLKTGVAIVSVIGAVSSAAASWAAAAGTGGLGVPLAALVTVHSSNTIANSFTDLYNIWLGDKDQVGEVDHLKTIDQAAFGENAGKVVYTAGSLASSIASIAALSGSVIQAADMKKALGGLGSDLQKGASGIAGIAEDVLSGTTGLSHAGIQLNLLGKSLTHIKDLSECVGVLYNVADTTQKIGNGIADTVYECMNPGETRASFSELIFGTNTDAGITKSIVKDTKSNIDGFNQAVEFFQDIKDGKYTIW
jgi:hypothetical protein